MKKFLLLALGVVTAFACCLGVAACKDEPTDDDNGGNGDDTTIVTPQDTYPEQYVGEWVLYSAIGTDNVVYTVGDTVPAEVLGNNAAMTLASDYSTLTVSADGKFVWTNDYDVAALLDFKEINGTWRERSNEVTFIVPDGEASGVDANYTATISDGKLSLSLSGDVTVFTKA